MKLHLLKVLFICSVLSVTVGCVSSRPFSGMFKTDISAEQAVQYKIKLDATENVAAKGLIIEEVQKTNVLIDRALVVDIVESYLVDYSYCVVVEIPTEKGIVNFYLYTREVEKVAQLEKGVSYIRAKGEFSRFFELLDNSFAKIEVVRTKIEQL